MGVVLERAHLVSPNDHLADLLWETGPAVFPMLFGSDKSVWRNVFRAEWTAKVGLVSRESTVIAVSEGRQLGLINYISGVDLPEYASSSLDRVSTILSPTQAEQWKRGFESMGWLFPPVPEHALCIPNIAVERGARGLGVGRMLMMNAEEVARNKGLGSIHLDVATDKPAVEFYRRMGFTPLVETKLCQPPGGYQVPSHYRMVKSI